MNNNWYNVSKGLEEFFDNSKHIFGAEMRLSVNRLTFGVFNGFFHCEISYMYKELWGDKGI